MASALAPAVLTVLSQLAMTRANGPSTAGRAALRGLVRGLVLNRLRRWLGPVPVERLVELGCGEGEWALRYLALAERVIGVEPDARLVARARRAAWQAHLGGRVLFLRLGLERFVRYQGAGLVCLGRPLHAFGPEELSRLLGQVAAGLGPGGRVYLRARVGSALDGLCRVEPGRAALEASLRRLGLEVEDAFYATALLPGAALDELAGLPPALAGHLLGVLWAALRDERPGGRECHLLLRVEAPAVPALALAG